MELATIGGKVIAFTGELHVLVDTIVNGHDCDEDGDDAC